MEVPDKVLVLEGFLDTTHGRLGCTNCHGGDGTATDRDTAHENMHAAPSYGEGSVCEDCHTQEVATFEQTLHFNLKGIADVHESETALRANPAKFEQFEEGMTNHCASCHTTTCGECHVSRPKSAGGGFVRGHEFLGTPNSVLNCTACHGSRIEREFMGKTPETFGQRLSPDVHWIQGQMQCAECHTYEWIHDPEQVYRHRYDDTGTPMCETCHDPNSESFARVEFHQVHSDQNAAEDQTLLQCQVCHSQPYNNCESCHVAKDDKGLGYFTTERSWFTFKIGENHLKSEKRPYDYVVVRHVPVDRDTFSFYGEDILTNFNVLPTWKYATPHNILLRAPQTESCESCHGNPDLFLRAEDVHENELEANEDVIVDQLPSPALSDQ